MNWDLYLAFISAAVALTLMPGPDNIFVLTESISRGAKRGVSLSAGLASGVMVHTFLAATGIALLLYEFPQIAVAIRAAGTLYLVYIAFLVWQDRANQMAINTAKNPLKQPNFWKSFGKGFLMNVLNPKVTLFFLALLPQFVDPNAAGSSFMQMFIMGLTFMLQAFVLFSVIALVAGRLHRFLSAPNFWLYTAWLQVVVLLLIAGGLWFL